MTSIAIGILFVLGTFVALVLGAIVIIVKFKALFSSPQQQKTVASSAPAFTFRKRRFFTDAERAFYFALVLCVGRAYAVAPKVGLWNLVECFPYHHVGWNKIS